MSLCHYHQQHRQKAWAAAQVLNIVGFLWTSDPAVDRLCTQRPSGSITNVKTDLSRVHEENSYRLVQILYWISLQISYRLVRLASTYHTRMWSRKLNLSQKWTGISHRFGFDTSVWHRRGIPAISSNCIIHKRSCKKNSWNQLKHAVAGVQFCWANRFMTWTFNIIQLKDKQW